MLRPETDPRATMEQASRDDGLGRDLVVIEGSGGERASRGHGPANGRPRAEFLTQLMVSADPAMRPSRGERTRAAAARYAETEKRRA